MINQHLHISILQGLVFMLFLANITDITNRKIPNILIIFGLLFSLLCQIILNGAVGLNIWILGAGTGLICFLPMYLIQGMSAGDVKLLMAIGGFVGYPLIINVAIEILIVGGLMALFYLLSKRLLVNSNISPRLDCQKVGLGKMPFAPAIATGTMLALYLHGI